jgi:hypothetical protein
MSKKLSFLAEAGSLANDHVRMEAVIERLMPRVRSRDFEGIDAEWDDLARQVEQHLSDEERHVFPAVALEGAEARELVAALLEDHARIRAAIAELGVDLQLHVDAAAGLERLRDALREHVAKEDAALYARIAEAAIADEAGVTTFAGVLGGAAAGALIGAIAGPAGAAVGAVVGSAVGIVAGAVLADAEHDRSVHDEELDRDIGVIGGHIGEASPNAPRAVIGAFSRAAAGAGGGSSDDVPDSAGPIQSLDR